ncbi:MAG: ACP S-malonyltransferase [Candidatus Hydrogenedentota bacterium]
MTCYLFPGQGAQSSGMGQDFYENSAPARAVFEEAAAAMPDGFLHTLFSGPAETLNKTTTAQPAILTVECAITADLQARRLSPTGAAGHSLGEIAALVALGALTFGGALHFVQARAKAMSEDVPAGGMAAVMGLAAETVEQTLPVEAQVANFNGPAQTIITGTKAGLAQAAKALKAAGAKRVLPLKVSGPFHSWLMRPAAEKLRPLLADMRIAPPRTTFISSVRGGPVDDPEDIRGLLAQQLYAPVRWTDVMAHISGRACVEVGPGTTLQGLAKRMQDGPVVSPANSLAAVDALAGEIHHDDGTA